MTNKSQIYEEDFVPDFQTDDETMFEIKTAIQELRPVERTILLTYVEGQTYTSVAKKYGVSVPTARNYIREVIRKIKDKIDYDN